jgi:hypothetical protein
MPVGNLHNFDSQVPVAKNTIELARKIQKLRLGGGIILAENTEPVLEQVPVVTRAIQVDEAIVVLEGRWQPVGVTAATANNVRVVCKHAEQRCREELTHAAPAKAPTHELFDYSIVEWSRTKLVARRASPRGEVEIGVSLTGNAAEKTMTEAGKSPARTRARLE